MCELEEICQRVLVPHLSNTPNEVNKEISMIIQSVQSIIVLKSLKIRNRDDMLVRDAGISALEVVRKKIEWLWHKKSIKQQVAQVEQEKGDN